jgi:hypothetical protein
MRKRKGPYYQEMKSIQLRRRPHFHSSISAQWSRGEEEEDGGSG